MDTLPDEIIQEVLLNLESLDMEEAGKTCQIVYNVAQPVVIKVKQQADIDLYDAVQNLNIDKQESVNKVHRSLRNGANPNKMVSPFYPTKNGALSPILYQIIWHTFRFELETDTYAGKVRYARKNLIPDVADIISRDITNNFNNVLNIMGVEFLEDLLLPHGYTESEWNLRELEVLDNMRIEIIGMILNFGGDPHINVPVNKNGDYIFDRDNGFTIAIQMADWRAIRLMEGWEVSSKRSYQWMKPLQPTQCGFSYKLYDIISSSPYAHINTWTGYGSTTDSHNVVYNWLSGIEAYLMCYNGGLK